MKSRVMFPDIEDREEWHEDDAAAVAKAIAESGDPAPVLDAPSEMAIGFVPNRGENRAQRRKAVALFKEPEPGLRRKLWAQRVRQRMGELDIETRRIQRKART